MHNWKDYNIKYKQNKDKWDKYKETEKLLLLN